MDTTTRPSLWKYFILCLTKKYCAFSGTAPRREFWGFFLFMNLFSFIFSLVGGVIVAVTLPWGELAAMQDPEQMQAILFIRIASFFFITQIVLLVLYLPILGHPGALPVSRGNRDAIPGYHFYRLLAAPPHSGMLPHPARGGEHA